MENQRLFLFLALGAVLFLLWDAWQQDYGPRPPTPQSTEQAVQAPQADGPAEELPTELRQQAGLAAQGMRISVVTDLFAIEINTVGGGIGSAKLLKHATSTDDPAPFTLLRDQGKPLFVVQAGLRAKEGSAPGTQARFQSRQKAYQLASGEQQLVVPLVWHGPNGITVTRRYIFQRGKYTIDIEQEVQNASAAPWSAYQYTQLLRGEENKTGGLAGQVAYIGGAIYSPDDKYQKISFDEMQEQALDRTVQNGWVAMVQHYFLAAMVPPRGMTERFYSRIVGGDLFSLGMSSPWQTIQPGQSGTFQTQLYLGPKDQERMASVASGLELTVDYGIFTIIAKPMFVVLSWFHAVVGNWGWAIVFLTVLIKAVFFKLSETSYRSMARMRKLQPRMQQLKEQFGDDRQRMNQELMTLYKREKVNPLGGCLPILIQIPVFIALYWVLLESVELRQAPFILWLRDLSAPDPYYVLPIIMGLTMLAQQRLNPAPMDPIQQKIMLFMPVVFTGFFLFFPGGLVLYYTVNNSLSILQQWLITRRIDQTESKTVDVKKLV
ncbi:membrane protein insertase YidC [Nitrococcus mobilis]|uniref:Membrane protein insertase YidC n=1 Tax=Nitrococcus mobilis Nb-231 TaxID=314278 RepID=A4BP05_9GAMM|nr:membrane protein insertase YidC [Nitrococcus mobilis]EAR22954.1 60 kDa inner membrane insertion protein [Nitrococcus mobilis Nb-231]